MNFCAIGVYINASRVVDESTIGTIECVVAQKSIRSVREEETSR